MPDQVRHDVLSYLVARLIFVGKACCRVLKRAFNFVRIFQIGVWSSGLLEMTGVERGVIMGKKVITLFFIFCFLGFSIGSACGAGEYDDLIGGPPEETNKDTPEWQCIWVLRPLYS